jgi:hypothetical protein
MNTASLRVNQLSQSATEWYAGYLAALDSADPDPWIAKYLHPDCVININNDLPLDGAAEIKARLALQWANFSSIRHEPINIYGNDNQFAVEMICRYERRDGKHADVPLATFVDRDASGLATMINIYIDPKPQFV